MSNINRRHALSQFASQFVAFGGAAVLLARTASAAAAPAEPTAPLCLSHQSEIETESNESPFFQHFHELALPLSPLLHLPANGVSVTTSPIDLGSYDVEAFKKFVAMSGENESELLKHSHDVKITKDELTRIARGDKDVEIRVISNNGNYVHNFLVTATPSTLAKVKRFQKGLLKV